MPEQTEPTEPQEQESVPQKPQEEQGGAEPTTDAAAAPAEGSAAPPVEKPGSPVPKASSAKERILAYILVAIIAVGGYLVVRNLYQQYTAAKARAAAGAAGGDALMECAMPVAAPEPVGATDAKIKVVACMGHCIAPAMVAMAKVASAWPGKIRAEFHALESPEGQQIVQEHGASRACVFINDKNEFTLKRDGKEETVRLEGPPGADYQLTDIVDALRATFQEVYGEVPDDFDEVTTALTTVKFGL